MLQYLVSEPEILLPASGGATWTPVRAPGAHAISWAPTADAPLFALVCAQFGLPLEDGRGGPVSGRHLALVPRDVPPPTAVSEPTIALLERTLAALRAWEPDGLAEASGFSRR